MNGLGARLGFIAVSTIAAPTIAHSNEEIREKLGQDRQLIVTLLARVENGQPPCTRLDCQSQKVRLLSESFNLSQSLPNFLLNQLHSNEISIRSAHSLVRQKFSLPASLEFPKTFSEWKEWWKRRYSFEADLKSRWMSYVSEAYATSDALKAYIKIVNFDDEQKDMIRQAWQRRLPEIARLTVQSAVEIQKSRILASQGKNDAAAEKRNLALELNRQREDLEAKFGSRFRDVVEELFPEISFAQTLTTINLISEWLKAWDSNDIFDPALAAAANTYAAQLKALAKLNQDFNDLEYGVIGIKNFQSPVNPAVLTEYEIPIQEFLDEVDSTARDLCELGGFIYLSSTGKALFGSLGQGFLPAAAKLFSIQWDYDPTVEVWENSSFSADLKESLPALQTHMERRHTELFNTQEILRQRLTSIDQKIHDLETKGQL